MNKKMLFYVLLALVSLNIFAAGNNEKAQSMTLNEAIKLTADELGQQLGSINLSNIHLSPNESINVTANELRQQLNRNVKIAVLNYSSNWQQLSAYVIDEMNNAIVRNGLLTVVDRQQLDLVRQEQNFQISGDVDDKSAQNIGKFLGAQSVLSGSLTVIGKIYLFRIKVIDVETGVQQYSNSINIKKDSILTALMQVSQQQKNSPSLPRQPSKPIEVNPFFNLGFSIGGGENVAFDYELLCFQAGINLGHFDILGEAIGGFSFEFEDDEIGLGYHLGGLLEYRFFDKAVLGLGGGYGGSVYEWIDSYSYPYIRSSASVILGICKLGGFYDYCFDYGSRFGLRAFIEIRKF